MFNQLTPVVKNLLIINVLVFLASEAMPELKLYLSGFYFESNLFRPWQLVTHMFMHGGFTHIFFNMYALFLFGSILESQWGGRRFLTYYILCGLGAFGLHEFVNFLEIRQLMTQLDNGELQMVVEEGYGILLEGKNFSNQTMASLNLAINIPVVGASGAVFGLLLAFGMLFPDVRLQLLFPPVALKAKWFVLIYGAIELMLAIGNMPGDSIAHYAHLGGMLFGYLILKFWSYRERHSGTF
ncbi:MAG: rhomboid family intramembrane serine protease [Flavobacteriales bacterium]|jgi:membrane associated rhomboid family serine protease